MPKLVLMSRKPLGQTQLIVKTSRSSLDVGHDVSPRACAVFVNVTGSHVTFVAREFHVTMRLGLFLHLQLNANVL